MVVLSKNVVTREGNVLVTEASTAGLAPGEWPDFIAVLGEEGGLFGPAFDQLPDGGRRYFCATGPEQLRIFND